MSYGRKKIRGWDGKKFAWLFSILSDLSQKFSIQTGGGGGGGEDEKKNSIIYNLL
jgi:hypothetical protein